MMLQKTKIAFAVGIREGYVNIVFMVYRWCHSLPRPCTVLPKSHLIPGQDGDEEAVAEDGQGEQVAAKQTKKRPQKKTVEQNLSNINLSESEMKCEVNNIQVWFESSQFFCTALFAIQIVLKKFYKKLLLMFIVFSCLYSHI